MNGFGAFEGYDLGLVAGQKVAGGAAGEGESAWATYYDGYFGPPLPEDSSVIADPTGAGEGKVLKLAVESDGQSRTAHIPLSELAATWDGDSPVTVEWDFFLSTSNPDYPAGLWVMHNVDAYDGWPASGSWYSYTYPVHDSGAAAWLINANAAGIHLDCSVNTWHTASLTFTRAGGVLTPVFIAASLDGVDADITTAGQQTGENSTQDLAGIGFKPLCAANSPGCSETVYIGDIRITGLVDEDTTLGAKNPLIPTISRNVNAGGCYDGRRRGWEVRAYRIATDRLSGEAVWRRLKFPGMAVRDCRFTHRKDGGMAQCDVSISLRMGSPPTGLDGRLAAQWPAAPSLQPNDRISVWVYEDGEWREWWRGYFQEGRYSIGRPDTYEISAYGAIERFRGISVRRQYGHYQQDISTLFAQLITDYADPFWEEIGFPTMTRDIRAIGVSVGETRRFDGTLADALSDVVRGVAGVTWGVELDGNGFERVYLRPMPESPKYVLSLGHDASGGSWGEDHADVVNTLVIEGSKALYPNLAKNGGFEQPIGENANLIQNSSFELGRDANSKKALHWNRVGLDPSRRKNGDDPINAATGEFFMEIDRDGEAVESAPVAVTGGGRYVFRVSVAGEANGRTMYPVIDIKAWDGATLVDTVHVTAQSGAANAWWVENRTWRRFEYWFDMPAGATTATVLLTLAQYAYNDKGIGYDDVLLAESDDMRQEGWTTDTNDTTGGLPASSITALWAETDDPYEGAYFTRLAWVTGNNASCFARLIQSESISVTDGYEQEFTISVSLRNTGTSAQSIYIGAQTRDKDGNWEEAWDTKLPYVWPRGWEVPASVSVPADGEWYRHTIIVRTWDDTVELRARVGVKGANLTGGIDVDAMYVFYGSTYDEQPFVESGENILHKLSTEDGWFQDAADEIGRLATDEARDSVKWHGGELDGQAHYGVRAARVSAPKVRTAADARRYFVNWANQRAVARGTDPVEVNDRIRNIRADGLVRLVNTPGRDGLTLLPVQASHTLSRVGWRCSVDRQTERRDLATLLRGEG